MLRQCFVAVNSGFECHMLFVGIDAIGFPKVNGPFDALTLRLTLASW